MISFTGNAHAEILVAAASDLAPLETSLRKLAPAGTRFTFGSSGQIANQIRAGAPYDVFLSADVKIVNALAAAGRVEPATVTRYALGRLGLWSRNGAAKRLEDLRAPAILQIAIANPDHAPYGAAARQALERSGVWETVRPRLVYGENVRQAMQFAASGNAEAAIVSWSLVKDRGGVLLDESLHAPIEQAGAVVAGSKERGQAEQFLRALVSAEGQALLRDAGFAMPVTPETATDAPAKIEKPKPTRARKRKR